MNDTPISDTQATDETKQSYEPPTLEPLGPWTIAVGDCVTSPQNC